MCVIALFVVTKRIWSPDFRLGSGFWLFLPTEYNFLCLLFGSLILYLHHGYAPGALFAEIWVLGSMLCYVLFETALRVLGISEFIFYLLTLAGAPLVSDETMQVLKLEMNTWDEGDSFALWTFYALGVCCVQAHEIPKYMFLVGRRHSHGLSSSSSSSVSSSFQKQHQQRQNGYVHVLLHLCMFLSYTQLLGSMYRVANSTWSVDENGHLSFETGGLPNAVAIKNDLKGFKLAFVLVPVCTSCAIAMLTQPHVRRGFDMFAELISKPPEVVNRAPRRSRNLGRVVMSVLEFFKDEESMKLHSLNLFQVIPLIFFLFGLITSRPLLSGISVPFFLFLREVYVTMLNSRKNVKLVNSKKKKKK